MESVSAASPRWGVGGTCPLRTKLEDSQNETCPLRERHGDLKQGHGEPPAYIVNPGRLARDISAVAAASLSKHSLSGFHFTSRPSISEMFARWQVVIVR
jgi:hypothetical protein